MSFKDGLYRARSHIVFLAALMAGFALVYNVDGSMFDAGQTSAASASLSGLPKQEELPLAGPAELRPDQLEWGRIAWGYFRRNINSVTGLANSADGYPSTTMWDTGSYLLGLISAERLGLVSRAEFSYTLQKALASLSQIELFDGRLPNKAYNTETLVMVDYNNKPSEGIGYSSLDIARVMVPLAIVARSYPEFAPDVQKVLSRWSLKDLQRNGELVGVTVGEGASEAQQEGRLGYEQYGARALAGYFLDVQKALSIGEDLKWVEASDIQIPYDKRSHDAFDADVYTTNEPYLLAAFEFGLDAESRLLLDQIYRAQEERFRKTGILTAVSEGQLNEAPYFAYGTVFGNGREWAVLSPDGKFLEDGLRTLSTKTAFGLDAVYNSSYTAKLVGAAVDFKAPEKGWLEGRYESGSVNSAATANTNGIILEGLYYRQYGPLASVRPSIVQSP